PSIYTPSLHDALPIFQDIEPLDRGNHQRVVTHRAVWFLFAGPRHMCVRLSKGQKLAKLKVFDAGLPVASDDGQRGSGLRIYLILERPREAGTKAMGKIGRAHV